MNAVTETFGVLVSVWRSMLMATGLLMIALVAGLMIGRERTLLPIRVLSWWVHGFVAPMLAWRSGAFRAGAIFANNMLILVALVAAGAWPIAGIVGIAIVGLSMGIALGVLAGLPEAFAVPGEGSPRLRRRMRIGILLNLLEPPAIVAALGLALGRAPAHLASAQVWSAVAVWIVAPMAVAACGESLWIGAGRAAHHSAPSRPTNSDKVGP